MQTPPTARAGIVGRILAWYDEHARDLPWRADDRTPWGVFVSEIMLQQTPVARVLGPWREWLARWPEPTALADAPTADVLRAWGRLGYPRRALRLHAAARAIADDHDGAVPADVDALRALPGIGDYTAAAVASFAFGQRHVVLDTNVRRVLARVLDGAAFPTSSSPTRAERERATALLPADAATAARWAVAVMELGALVCTARSPACPACPVADACAWRAAGSPAPAGPPRRGQAWEGTDRQCRGRVMAALRERERVGVDDLTALWPDAVQLTRCLDGLRADGLAVPDADGVWSLPT